MQFPWNDQREKTFLDRYALKDRSGDLLETKPHQMWNRVAQALSFNRWEEDEFRYALEDFMFVPAGRVLAAAGSGQNSATFYNCFVLGMDSPLHKGKDSRDAIMHTISQMVELNCRGGGVGINWSALRPDMSKVRGVQGLSTGPIGWMKGADALADQVRQGGSRTAALMFMLDDWHPDVVQFVKADRFKRANFSVSISDEFMEALYSGRRWRLRFPDTADPAYDVVWSGDIEAWEDSGKPVIEFDIDPNSLWKRMCESARESGNPGVVFLDRCNQMAYGDRLVATNPCGEQPLPEYGSCNLGSLNLAAFCSENGDINRALLSKVIRTAVRMLDNIIDLSPPTFYEIDSKQKMFRRIGLGVMGFADALILNKIRYGSEESLAFIRDLFSFIRDTAFMASHELAEERGSAPMFCEDEFVCSYIASTLPDPIREACSTGMRNTAILTMPPTGTISVLAGVNSGIEPVFSADYIRRDATGEHRVHHPLFGRAKASHLVTAHQIPPMDHIAVQAELQRHIDASISKTINMPASATEQDIDQAFRIAYDMGCKGVTVYRNESIDEEIYKCEACQA